MATGTAMGRKKKAKDREITVSEARSRLFELVEKVADNPREEVVIEHRDGKGKAVLVDSHHYEYLKATAHGVMTARERPFRLYGSMRLAVPEDEFDSWLDDNRKSQAELSARKLDDL